MILGQRITITLFYSLQKKRLKRQRKQDVERDVMRSMDDCFNLMNSGIDDF